jgi:hypothetical protein
MFQNPGTDNITIITTDGKPTKLISLAAYQVSQTFNDSLVIEGWNGSILKYSHSFPADTSWSTLSLNYDNITKIVIKINSDNSGNLVDYNFDNITFQEAILPVELVTFKGISGENGINLEWQTATEVNNHGFEIERITNSSWVKIGFVEGKGNSNTKNNYSFNDKFPIGDTVHYRLKQIDNDGKFKYSNEIEVTSGQFPKEYYLSQNYPNPFNPGTVINFRTPKAGKVVLKIYDLLGKEVVTLVDGYKSPGSYSVTFNASAYSSGIYIYVLKSDGFTSIKKMTLLK